ncbi:UDP-N-acetylglucosamine 2-epimerase (non-hydrolyzing) [Brachybacterium muris]|uniref:non-hydrolyzing UDP-N-acetylglucosamine 2-epimerase n=1 Tax=Brachybacterium muris TaxID=219301 RepID=UPI0021A77BBD|nr:UDP-N-acetylglucosamine 2-epimerase (non-hydrolyzing) [Brachybacterium muris]MCT1429362.1 UDP-N-acetylglucosamine 2-epimerase (non-hydrolyzing) [Brachybacterium muris]
MHFLHVVGARPNLPKLAPVFNALRSLGATQFVVHTGQHFSTALTESIARDLELPEEDVNLEVGAGTGVEQIAGVMLRLEPLIAKMDPRTVLVYGDVNSTLGAALTASKLGIRLAHVEAGLRSRDRSMPEETNRILTDALADISFTTSEDAVEHLVAEGKDPSSIHFVGNPMIDSLRRIEPRLEPSPFSAQFGNENYALATIHRPSNVDDPDQLERIVRALDDIAGFIPLVFPLHPRRREEFLKTSLAKNRNVLMTAPLSYSPFLSTMRDAAAVITDSGGVQEETTAFGVPCFTLRPTTERPVTITHGTNQMATTATLARLLQHTLSEDTRRNTDQRMLPPLWDGHAGERIATILTAHC